MLNWFTKLSYSHVLKIKVDVNEKTGVFLVARLRKVSLRALFAALGAIANLIPVSSPFLAPAKWSAATKTGLFRQIEFFVGHLSLITAKRCRMYTDCYERQLSSDQC